MTARPAFFDVTAQLGRGWLAVAGGALIATVIGVAVNEALDGRNGQGLTPIGSLVILFVFFVAGSALGLLVGLALTRLAPRVTTADDVRRVTGLPVLAQLPQGVVDSDDLELRPASRRMRSSLRESVMNIRSLAGGELPRRLVLARTEDVGEASGVDGGLARALLESGFATAVLQTDIESQLLVRPSTAPDTAVEDAPHPDASGYQRIPVPDRVAAARPELLQAEVEKHLTVLGERYDVTVALSGSNSHPVPLRGIAPIADAVVIVVRSNRTRIEDLLALHGELVGLGVQPLGVLMTGVAGRHREALRREWIPSDFRVAADSAPVRPLDTDRVAVVAPFPRAAPISGSRPSDPEGLDDRDDLDGGSPAATSAPRFSIADLAQRAEEAEAQKATRNPATAHDRRDRS